MIYKLTLNTNCENKRIAIDVMLTLSAFIFININTSPCVRDFFSTFFE